MKQEDGGSFLEGMAVGGYVFGIFALAVMGISILVGLICWWLGIPLGDVK